MNTNELKAWVGMKLGAGYDDCDCDCDCSIVPLTLENVCELVNAVDFVNLRGKELNVAKNLLYGHLDETTSYVFNPNGVLGIIILSSKLNCAFDNLKNSSQTSIQTTNLSRDTENAISLLYSLGLLVDHASAPLNIPEQANYFSVWLHLTNACNLDCTYCYIDKSNTFMSLEVGTKAIDKVIALTKEQNLKNLKIKYAGGEPIVNFDVLKSLQRYAIKRCRDENIHLDSVLLTNGILVTEDVAKSLKELNFRVMVSFDTIDSKYDLRVNSNGKTFTQQVAASMEVLVSHQVDFEVSVTVSARNINALPDTVQFLIERQYRFNLNYNRNRADHEYTNEQLTNKELTLGILKSLEKVKQLLPKRSIINAFVDKANFIAPHTNTCSAGRNYLVIDCDGSVSLCQMKMEDKIGKIDSENIMQLVSLNNDVFKSVEDKVGCKMCEWKYWCAGGCPVLALREYGLSDIKSPYCDVYRSIFPQIVKVEAYILNKYKDEMTFEFPSTKEN